MQKDELEMLLYELYDWNPKLKNKEAALIKLIKAMVEAKPDTKFDEFFAADLKKDLLSHQILLDEREEPRFSRLLINLKNMNQKFYVATGAAVALCLLALIIVPSLLLQKKPIVALFENKMSSQSFTKMAPGAFGSLLAIGGASNVNPEVAAKSAGGAVSVSSKTSDSVMTTSLTGLGSVGMAVAPSSARMDSKMMPPLYSYKYVYKGDPLALTDETGAVYRRIKGDGNLSSNIDSLISTKTFGPLNLNSFSDLQTNSIALSENKKLGLTLNIDFREENIYIGENWLYWQSERDKCANDQACWDSYRLKINDIPDDASLIAMTDKFLSEKGINLEHYSSAVVDNNWRIDYEKSQDKNNYYIPEYATVIYPLTVNDQSVYDQSGNLDGLKVTVNLLQKAVSGVNNLTSYRYESSDYALETSSDKILGLAENGGYSYSNYYSDTQKKVDIELGTPTKSLVHFFRYTNNVNEELLVPALIFPILNTPEGYYGSKFVTVPLAKEMVDELINQKNSIITPMPYDLVSPAASTGSGAVQMMIR